MSYRTTKFVSAISAGVAVGLPCATIPGAMLEAAEECLAKPKDVAPPGQHWYYLIDRASKRHCWYLHQEIGTSHAAISRRARRAAIVASRENEPALPRKARNAYAEFGVPEGGEEKAPPVSQQTLIASDYPKGAGQDQRDQDQRDSVSGDNAPSVVASRWPEPAGVSPASIEPPQPASFAVASATPDASQDVSPVDLTPKVPPVALTSADPPATGTPASLKSLLLATFGAITISGFAGSSVYLLAQMRRRTQSPGNSGGPGRPPTEWIDRSRPPPWLYRDGALAEEVSSDEMG